MNYSKFIISALILAGAISTQADVLSPDTRILLENRVMSPLSEGAEMPKVRVFVAVESPEVVSSLLIPGVAVQGVYNNVATVSVELDKLEALAAIPGVRYIQKGTKVNLLNDFGRRATMVDDVHANTGNVLPQPYTGKGVVVGVIDLGVEYGHRAFYNSDGSELRIRRVWEQDSYGTSPEAFDYGRELSTPADILAKTYDTAQENHGTHTMGTAAGGGDLNTKYKGMAPDADIVFVSFAQADNTYVADAIKYIFDYADEVDKPCVINMSLGSHYGPHDGTSYLDQIIDELSGPGRIIVGACGNEGEARLHAAKTFTEADQTLLTMLTFNSAQSHRRHYVDIWGTKGSNLSVAFTIVNSLKGQVLKRSTAFDTSDPEAKTIYNYTYLDADGAETTAIIRGEINPENGAPHVWIESYIEDLGTGRMPGLEIKGDPGATVHMWNVGLHEFSSNGKAKFTNGTNDCSVGEIGGTANRIITVGSYDGRRDLPWSDGSYSLMEELSTVDYKQYRHSSFSSYGPTADGRTVPHVLAPGMPVISALNRYSYITEQLQTYTAEALTGPDGRTYYYVYNMGTSMSAPHVAGIIALMLQANPQLTPEQAREYIQSTAITDDEMGTLPNNTYGAGRINALEAVKRTVQAAAIDAISADSNPAEATQMWADRSAAQVYVSTPSMGSNIKVFNTAGALIYQADVNDTFTTVDASAWGHGIFVGVVSNGSASSSFKLAL